ncbi:hypothetical protein I862_05665 [endosymbiont of Acanthamoeba sp. UWC8]|nr:hypothetical protein I862_05665 [endosymbiont of Acanthamoeba sp. UWC8]
MIARLKVIIKFSNPPANQIMRLTFLRHAHSSPAGDDKNRILTSKGIEQALTYKKISNDVKYDLVIHSSAVRTRETAEIILYRVSTKVPYIEIPTLYLPEDDKDISEVSKSIMLRPYATPNEILSKDKNNSWERYTNKAYTDISSAIKQYNPSSELSHVLIIGHGTILNLIGYKFSSQFEEIKTRYIGYLEGFSLNFNKKTI